MARPLVIFDIDGTLLDTAPDLLRALNAVLADEGLPPMSRAAMAINFGRGAKALITEGFRRAGQPLLPERAEALVHRFLALYAAGIAVETTAFPGAVAALDRLADRGVRLAVCSNKREHLVRPLLTTLGLIHRFDAVIGGDSLPFRKPEAGHILGTIAAAGGGAEATVMVGDSDADILAARGAGVPVVAVSFGYSPEPLERFAPDAVIASYDELDAALAGVSAAFRRNLA